jgi:hypothetical protein
MDIHLDLDIRAGASRVWDVLGHRFMAVADWAAPISQSCPIGEAPPAPGVVRECHTVGIGPVAPGRVRERLTAFDNERRTLSYEAAGGMPGFVAGAVNRWSVAELGPGRSQVRMHATFTLRGAMRLLTPLMRWQMRREARLVLLDLKHFIEHGTPHPRKIAAIAAHRTNGA